MPALLVRRATKTMFLCRDREGERAEVSVASFGGRLVRKRSGGEGLSSARNLKQRASSSCRVGTDRCSAVRSANLRLIVRLVLAHER
jgi:hypothetical protein